MLLSHLGLDVLVLEIEGNIEYSNYVKAEICIWQFIKIFPVQSGSKRLRYGYF